MDVDQSQSQTGGTIDVEPMSQDVGNEEVSVKDVDETSAYKQPGVGEPTTDSQPVDMSQDVSSDEIPANKHVDNADINAGQTEGADRNPDKRRRTDKPEGQRNNEFPSTIEGFGYKFDEEQRLRSITTGESFVFVVKENDRSYNQKRYDALGEVIAEHIYELLEKEEEMEKVIIPLDAKPSDGTSFIYQSKNWQEKEKVMLLIQGSGVVRPGQWARRLIINDSLKTGTQIPYIRKAKKEGYGVIILNPNQNTDIKDKKTPVRGSESPEDHFLYVWDNIIMKSKVEHIGIVAHSFGGFITIHGLKRRKSLPGRVFGVAFTDSVHVISHQLNKEDRQRLKPWLQKYCRNWVSCREPLDTKLKDYNKDNCPLVSAGTPEHTETSSKAMDSVFIFLEELYEDVLKRKKQPTMQKAEL